MSLDKNNMQVPAVFKSIQKQYAARQNARQEIIGRSNKALSRSKRAIFALHRDDLKGSESLLNEADKLFVKCEQSFKRIPNLKNEGAYQAALEEYAEALLFKSYIEKGKLGKIHERAMNPHSYLAGLSDTTGEIVRYAVRAVTQGDERQVKKAYKTVAMVIEYLIDMDLTGYQRTKFDQAKKNLRKLEQMQYDLAIRTR